MGIKKKHVPGCACCGGECFTYTEDFPSGTPDWSKESGTWTDSGGNAFTTSDFAQLIYLDVENWTDHFFVTMNISGSSTNGSRYRIIFGWEDSSNYWFAQFIFTAGSGTPNSVAIEIGQVVAGVSSTLASGSGYNSQVDNPAVCYLDGWIHAFVGVSDPNQVVVKLQSTPANGRFGIGTGDQPGTLSAGFDNFNLAINTGVDYSGNCYGCPNGCCDGYELADEIELVVSSLPSPYDTWNGTYTLYFQGYNNLSEICTWDNPDIGDTTATSEIPLENPNPMKTGQSSFLRVTRNAGTDTVSVLLRYTWADATSVSITGTGTTSGTFTDSPCNDDWGGTISLSSSPGTASITGIF